MKNKNITSNLVYVPIDEATTVREGQVMVNRWWIVHPEHGITFYRMAGGHRAPQCNHNEVIARSIQERLYPDHEVQLIPAVYLDRGDVL